MDIAPKSRTPRDFLRGPAAYRWQWRLVKDLGARYGVALGGIGVILAIVLIFFYLLSVVFPLFEGAEAKPVAGYDLPGGPERVTAHLAMEEQAEIAVRFTQDGHAIFFRTVDGSVLSDNRLEMPANVQVTSFGAGDPARAAVAFGLANGKAVVVEHIYKIAFPEDKRVITPAIEYPFGEAPIVVDPKGRALVAIAIQVGEDESTIAGLTDDNRDDTLTFGGPNDGSLTPRAVCSGEDRARQANRA